MVLGRSCEGGRWIDERMVVEDEGSGFGWRDWSPSDPTRCLVGGMENKDRDGEIDGLWTGVCGFQYVQSVVVSHHSCRDCGLTAHAPRHTLTHTLRRSSEENTFTRKAMNFWFEKHQSWWLGWKNASHWGRGLLCISAHPGVSGRFTLLSDLMAVSRLSNNTDPD